jgi:AcrR family transcriptional regulator
MAEQVPDSGDGASTKDRLLEAAAKVIARDGYQGARLADVAREAGLTTGAIYSNFRDKRELFLAAFDRVQQLSQNLAVDEENLEQVIASAPDGIRQFAESSELQILNLELALLGTRDPELRTYLRSSERDSIDRLAKRLPEHVKDRRERAALLLGLMNGLALMRMLGSDDVPVDAVVPWLRQIAGFDR